MTILLMAMFVTCRVKPDGRPRGLMRRRLSMTMVMPCPV